MPSKRSLPDGSESSRPEKVFKGPEGSALAVISTKGYFLPGNLMNAEVRGALSSSRPEKPTWTPDGFAMVFTNNRTVGDHSLGNLMLAENTDKLSKRVLLIMVVGGIPVSYKGMAITPEEAAGMLRNDPEYRKEVYEHNKSVPLLQMPTEILLNICEQVILSDGITIRPHQARSGSNQFLISQTIQGRPALQAPFAVLPLVSRRIHEIVAGGNLVYDFAKFSFSKKDYQRVVPAFFSAITEHRFNLIKDISIDWNVKMNGGVADMFMVLLYCEKLEKVELKLAWNFGAYLRDRRILEVDNMPGFEECTQLAHGVQVTFELLKSVHPQSAPCEISDRFKIELADIMKTIYVTGKKEDRYTSADTLEDFLQTIKEESGLDVYGHERLLCPHPRAADNAALDQYREGIFPNTCGDLPVGATANTDEDGFFRWKIVQILNSKVIEVADVEFRVMFLIGHQPRWRHNLSEPLTETWENGATLISIEGRKAILKFYKKEIKAGKEPDGIVETHTFWEEQFVARILEADEEYGTNDDVYGLPALSSDIIKLLAFMR